VRAGIIPRVSDKGKQKEALAAIWSLQTRRQKLQKTTQSEVKREEKLNVNRMERLKGETFSKEGLG